MRLLRAFREALVDGALRSPLIRGFACLGIAFSLAMTTGAELGAQEPGRIVGTVLDEQTLEPLDGAQVFVERVQLGSITDAQGRYEIRDVPPGEHRVSVRLIGYGRGTQTVTVVAGETVEADFELEESALGLDDIVVTGTAGAARKREIGNTISEIETDQIPSPQGNFEQLIQGRAAGVSVLPSSGLAGSGAQIRLRGNVSVAMSNQPLVYVDGVRIRSDGFPRNNADVIGRSLRGVNDAASPLGDINPADIERIEIIKGAAATTLYGTEAASGVIQIFTKKGRERGGRAEWTLRVDQGAQWMEAFGTDSNPFLNHEPWLETAHTQDYYLSVNGRQDQVDYFVSGDYRNYGGVLPNDHQEKWSLRGNLDFRPFESVQVSWNSFFTNNDIQNTPAGNNAQSITYNAFTHPGGFLELDELDETLSWEATSSVDHLVTGGTISWDPNLRITNRLTAGYDLTNLENVNLRPFGFISAPQGVIEVQRWRNELFTLDYLGNLRTDLTDDLRSTLSWGGQLTDTRTEDITAASQSFPSPGEATVSSGSDQLSAGTEFQVITGGFFVQHLLDVKDRIFLTTGVRVDGNSAFGEDLGLEVYPKVSASYVISDEEFWPEDFGSVKLRAAYGEAGRAPGAFDAVRVWDPVGFGGEPALEPLQVGNPELGPERTREIEVGFDGGFLDDRLRFDLTYYHQTTDDALFPVRQIPSEGFLGSQLENVGKLRNTGFEISSTAQVLEDDDLGLELGLNVSTNHSEVLELGDATPFQLAGRGQGWIREGQPVPVIYGPVVANPDAMEAPIVVDSAMGPNLPTLTLGFRTTLRLPGGVSFHTLSEYNGGHYIDNQAFRSMAQRFAVPQCMDNGAYAALENDESLDFLPAFWRGWCDPLNLPGQSALIVPADNFRFRDITLSAPVPFQIPLARDATWSVSIRNVFKWINDDVRFLDPEMAGQEGMHSNPRVMVETIPAPAAFVFSFKARL